jgi:hypothetical protein
LTLGLRILKSCRAEGIPTSASFFSPPVWHFNLVSAKPECNTFLPGASSRDRAEAAESRILFSAERKNLRVLSAA